MMITSRKFKVFFWVAICLSILLGTTQTLSTVTNDESNPLVISEFVAANQSGLTDEDGDYSDWIEIHNRGNRAINLSGWSLTDDASDPEKWPLPDSTLNANEYLVIFASGKDRRSLESGSALHTNFRLRQAGDFLALYNVLDQRLFAVSSPTFPPQFDDFSYGLRLDEPSYHYFAMPTPGGPNDTAQSWKDVVSEVKFSLARGFYEVPFQLELTTSTPDAIIRYTTDGSEPSRANGEIYSEPFEINTTTLVRAAAFKPDYLPSAIDTHTYIFLKDVVTQPTEIPGFFPWDYEMDPEIVNDRRYQDAIEDSLKAIPSLSIVTDIENYDIYLLAWERGREWERPISVELIYPDKNKQGFQINAGMRIQGGVGRTLPKRSFRLFFRKEYGPAQLNYPLFPDSPVETFDTLVLRGGANRTYDNESPYSKSTTYTRDEWARASQIAMSDLGSHGIFVHLYLNGLYWGLYNVIERPDTSFAASYLGGDKEDWFTVNHHGPTSNTGQEFKELDRQLRNIKTSTEAESYIDPIHFIDYIILNWYSGNEDWGDNNWYLTGPMRNGQAKYYVWDAERTWIEGANLIFRTKEGRKNVAEAPFKALMQNPDFKMTFADRMYKHLFNNGPLTDANAQARWLQINNPIEQAIIGESARWGDARYEPPITPADWRKARDDVLNQMEGNAAKLIALAREAGYYPLIDPPTFNRQGGLVPSGFELTMTASEGAIYYTTDGSDPRMSETEAVAATAMIYNTPLVITSTTYIKARTLSTDNSTSSDKPEWSALNETTFTVVAEAPNLAITEIMYNPLGGSDYEFIELKNVGNSTIDLSSMYFEGIDYTFPTKSALGKSDLMVLVRNPEVFTERYPDTAIAGVYEGKLANSGEQIVLMDSQDKAILTVAYDDKNGWPLSPDGRGDSLTLIDVNRDPNNPKSWHASSNPYGSPGIDEP